MNKNQRNKNKNRRNTLRRISKIANNGNLLNDILNQEKSKEQKDENKISYPPQIGEVISKIIIDKLITVSVSKSEYNEYSLKYMNYYYSYLTNQIENILALNNICYTEEPEDFEVFDYSKFWKTSCNKPNTWVEIKEPNPSKCDRHEGVFIKNIPFDRDNSNISNDLKTKNNNDSPLRDNNIINNKRDINSKKNKNKKNFKINELESLEEIGTDSGEEENILEKEKKYVKRNSSVNRKIKEKEKEKKKALELNLKESFSLEQGSSRKKKYEKVEFLSEDIPGINEEFNFEKYDPPEIKDLRNDMGINMKGKNEQISKNLLHLRRYSFLNKINIPKEKKFDSEKLTFDSNGQIINFKPLKLSSLVNDFKQMKNKLEMIQPLKKIPFADKNVRKGPKRKSSRANKNGINIEKNPDDDPELHRGLFIKINPEKKNKVIQSGNNFGLMLPSVGVVMKDENKIKRGNRDFGKFFKKYSMEDYDKILKEYLPKENEELVMNKLKRITSTSSFDDNKNNLISLPMKNSNNYYNNSFDFQNPLLNQDNLDNELNLSNVNSVISSRNNLNKINKKLFNNFKNTSINDSSTFVNNYSYITNRNKQLHIFNSNFNDLIKLKNSNSSSVKLELDALNDLDIKYQNFSPQSARKKLDNIFSKKYKNIFKKEKKEKNTSKELNDFNKMILNDIGWGNNTMRKNASSQNLLVSKHQSKLQVFKELGNSFMNNFKLKLPRERKTSILA